MGTPFAVSPDGRRIVFSGGAGGQSSLWLWSAEDGQSHRLEDTSGGISPFFSPDGREIAFFAGDDLRRVPVDGGPATTITAAPVASSGSWGSGGTILFTRSVGAGAGIYSVPARGGEPRPIALAPSPRERGGFARFLPDGRHYLFLKGFGLPVADRRLCVASVDGGEPDCFASCQSQAEYSGSGHVLCVRAGTLVALPFDARSRRPTGEAITVARDVRWFGPSGSASFAVSADGTTLVHEPRPAASRLAWLDRVGRQTAAVGEPGALGLLQLAPDGRRVVVDVMQPDGRGRDLWAFDTGSGVASRLTYQSIDASAGTWSPDGKSLAYAKAEDGPPDVTVLHLDGTGREEVLLRAPGVQLPKHWSPDGRSSPTKTTRRAGATSDSSGCSRSTERPVGSTSTPFEQLSRLLLARRARDRLRLGGVGRAGGLRRSPAGWSAHGGSLARAACCRAGGATGRSSTSSSRTA